MTFNLLGILLRLYQSYIDSGQGRFPEFENWLLHNLIYVQSQPITQDTNYEDFDIDPQQLIDFSTGAFRVYNKQEIQKLNASCRGYLLKLEMEQIISPTIREKIIQEALGINKNIELNDIEYLANDILMEENENQELQFYKLVDENQNQILH
jgi:uncharacterized protein Smg (DUF494 family)